MKVDVKHAAFAPLIVVGRIHGSMALGGQAKVGIATPTRIAVQEKHSYALINGPGWYSRSLHLSVLDFTHFAPSTAHRQNAGRLMTQRLAIKNGAACLKPADSRHFGTATSVIGPFWVLVHRIPEGGKLLRSSCVNPQAGKSFQE